MADSGSLRVRRHKRHARGDHSLCRPERCEALAPTNGDDDIRVSSGAVEASVVALLEPLVVKCPESDPRQVIAGCAMRLAEAIDSSTTAAGSLAGLVRELNVCLAQAVEGADQLPDEMDVMWARRAMRRLSVMEGDSDEGMVG